MVVYPGGHEAIGEPMNGYQDLDRGQPEWETGVISYREGLIEFVCQRHIKGHKGSSRGVGTCRPQGQ